MGDDCYWVGMAKVIGVAFIDVVMTPVLFVVSVAYFFTVVVEVVVVALVEFLVIFIAFEVISISSYHFNWFQ